MYQQLTPPQYAQQIGVNPGSNISFVPMRQQLGLIGGDLNSSITQVQLNSALAASQSQHLTMSSFPLATVNPPVIIPRTGPVMLNPGGIADSNLLVTQSRRIVPMNTEVAEQLQAPGQPFVGALPEPETKVLLETMDHYGSYNIFSFLDVHYPSSHCTFIPNKLYNKYRW